VWYQNWCKISLCLVVKFWFHLFNMFTVHKCSKLTMSTSVRFQVLTAACMMISAFWDIAPCSLIEVGWRFRATYWNISLLQRDYMELHPKSLSSSMSTWIKLVPHPLTWTLFSLLYESQYELSLPVLESLFWLATNSFTTRNPSSSSVSCTNCNTRLCKAHHTPTTHTPASSERASGLTSIPENHL
jgi:hypothetical protein